MSHPARGAWIETGRKQLILQSLLSRTPPGVRGLKRTQLPQAVVRTCRTPPGVRGLKHRYQVINLRYKQSHPARGAWIETEPGGSSPSRFGRTPPGVRGLKR